MRITDKSILVTGGAGFIGSHVAECLSERNPKKIIIVDNFFLGDNSNLTDLLNNSIRGDIQIIRMDASNFQSMSQICKDFQIDVVFDLAVIPLPTSLTFPEWTIATNIGIATTLCELARTNQIESIMHISSSEAYGSARNIPMNEDHPLDAITPYAASKSAADQIIQSYVQTYGVEATIVRPFNNFGPRQNSGSYAGIIPIVINRIRQNEPIEITWDGNQTRDFTFVKNCAKAIVDVYEAHPPTGEIYNIATGKETSINTLVSMIMQAMRQENYPVFYSEKRPGDVRQHCADVSKISRLINYVPEIISLEQLEETVNWYLRTCK